MHYHLCELSYITITFKFAFSLEIQRNEALKTSFEIGLFVFFFRHYLKNSAEVPQKGMEKNDKKTSTQTKSTTENQSTIKKAVSRSLSLPVSNNDDERNSKEMREFPTNSER